MRPIFLKGRFKSPPLDELLHMRSGLIRVGQVEK
jgi:hypothetical protein